LKPSPIERIQPDGPFERSLGDSERRYAIDQAVISIRLIVRRMFIGGAEDGNISDRIGEEAKRRNCRRLTKRAD
jgi:hypothetical protein